MDRQRGAEALALFASSEDFSTHKVRFGDSLPACIISMHMAGYPWQHVHCFGCCCSSRAGHSLVIVFSLPVMARMYLMISRTPSPRSCSQARIISTPGTVASLATLDAAFVSSLLTDADARRRYRALTDLIGEAKRKASK